ncbi:unnamed protein product [Mytilus coruscus]|uniref:Uncharacterized protein n=1 Tax=Mytilus coruscus TaxID=42192 RepID=A0A6J8CZ78_MYTCO|nr:unnamed protein product [Mytilus coruscus]
MYINLIVTLLIIGNPMWFCLSQFRGGTITWRYKNIELQWKLLDISSWRVNCPPTTSVPPVLRLTYGCFYSLSIPVKDEDGDRIRCRWASGSDECGGVCTDSPAKSIFKLNEKMCVLSYTATGSTGLYAVALQIEDFTTDQSFYVLSSTPLQFIILLTLHNSSESCDIKPVFESPHDISSVVEIPLYTTYQRTIITRGFNQIMQFQAAKNICTTVNVTSSINYCMENVDNFNTKWNITAEKHSC